MGAWQNADLGNDRPHRLGAAAVDPDACVQNTVAHNIGFHGFEDVTSDRLFGGVLQHLHAFATGRGDLVLPLGLVRLLIGRAQIDLDRLQAFFDGGHFRRRRGHVDRVLGAGFGQPDDCVDHLLHLLMAEDDGAKHDFLW